MTPKTRAELEETCREICPHCAKLSSMRQRFDTNEWIHDTFNKGAFTHAFCLASNYRNKYLDQIVE